MTVRKLTHMAVLTAVALTIFVLEAQLPPLVPMIPGVKLGLANVVTVYAIFALGSGPAAMILLARVVLGSLFAGGSTIFYSLAGGVCCFLAMALLRLVMTEKQMWACSALGAAAHNIGQIALALLGVEQPLLAALAGLVLAALGFVFQWKTTGEDPEQGN